MGSTIDSTLITLTISIGDLNDIKSQPELAISDNTTFVKSMTVSLASQMTFANSNQIVAIDQDNPLQVTNFTADVIGPFFIDFTLDMDSNMLVLTFSETINISSFDPSLVTLQSDLVQTSITENFTLTGGEVSSENDPIVRINITRDDANRIKQLLQLATQASSTFISFPESLVSDMSDLSVTSVNSNTANQIQPVNYILDTSSPVLERFDFDADAGKFTLYFDETVNGPNLIIRKVTVADGEDLDAAIRLELSGEVLTNSISPIVELQLDAADILAIKTRPPLGTSENTTYLLLDTGAISDTSLTPNIIAETFLKVFNYTRDSTGPILQEITIDLTSEEISMNFDEPVDVSSLDLTGLTAIAGPNSASFYTLTGGSTTSQNGYNVRVTLTTADLNEIKRLEDLWVSEDTAYISAEPNLIADPAGNGVVEITQVAPLRAKMFVGDTERPTLMNFDLDMDLGILTLNFSETVNVTSLMFSEVTLQNYYSTIVFRQASQFSLTTGTILSGGDLPFITIQLSRDNLNTIKRLEIANTKERAFLIISDQAILDQNGNNVVPRFDSLNFLSVRNYTPDTTDPMLESFNLDLTADTLTLSFDETVDVSTLDVTQITLHGSNDTTDFTLTNSGVQNTTDLPTIVIYLSEDDRNDIKRDTMLAIDANSTYLSFTNATITDMVSNPVKPIEMMDVEVYTLDLARPSLVNFDLDLTAETLTLFFSETVRVDTFNHTQVTLLGVNSSYSLVNSTTVDHGDEPILIVNLTRIDLNEIKRITTLATSIADTFISITNVTVEDMNENRVNEIESLMVRNFTQDLTPPELESFYLDMDASTLTFYFSETVNSLSFDPEIVVIQDAQLANRSYQLTGGNIVTENDSVLVLNITKADLDMIKFDSELATSSFTTYITFNSSLVVDMNSNAIVNISNGYGLRVANYTPDTTPPYLISYNLDLDSGEIELTFSETVNASSFRINEIVLQNNYINVTEPFNYYALESGGPVEITLCHNHCHDHINYGHCHYHCHSDIIRLNVSISDLNQLKARYMLARSRNDTFLVHTHIQVNVPGH